METYSLIKKNIINDISGNNLYFIINYCFQKNKNHSELIKLEIEKDNLNKENNKKSEEANNSNINTKDIIIIVIIESNFIIITFLI